MADANQPEFFMVFLPHYSSQRLHIPTEFVQHLGGRKSGSVLLTGPSGNPWKVELVQKKDGLFFDEGWPTFVRDHLIDVGEFLVFRYDGDLRFTVTIYDHSACQKESSFHVKCSQPIAIKENKRERVESATSSIEVLGETPKKPTKACSQRHGLSETEEQRAANSFTTDHPFFVVRIKKYYVEKRYLDIPITFLRKHHISYQNNDKVVLRNQKGESWLVSIRHAGRRCCLSAGFAYFNRDNKIEGGDICIFELVDKFKICVHIYRANTEH